MTSLAAAKLAKLLDADFAGENLERLAQEVLSSPLFAESPAPLLVLHHVAWELAQLWDGSVSTVRARQLGRTFGPVFRRLLAAVGKGDVEGSWRSADEVARLWAAEH